MLEQKLRRQAEFIAGVKPEELPPETLRAGKMILLDSIGCIAAGLSELPAGKYPKGMYPLFGRNERTDKTTAVFSYGTAMVRYELDEGNQFAFGHPACHIVPSLLAECVERDIAPKTFLTALAAAYEVTCRWSKAVRVNPAAHVHGTAATVGSCAASCKIAGLDAEVIYRAMLLAQSLPQCSAWESAFQGDQIRNGYVGLSNLVGSSAYRMNQLGVYSSIETVSSVWTKLLGSGIREDLLCEGLGQDWLIEKNYFKVHTACRYVHAFADMGLAFLQEGHKASDIKTIKIETYSAASKLSGFTANNAFAARFSIPVSLSILLLQGALNLDTVTDENVRSPDVLSLARKISVSEKPEFTALLPDIRFNRMTVILNDGSIWKKSADRTRGDYTLPFSQQELEDKFRRLTGDFWSRERQARIIDTALNLEAVENMKTLIKLLDQ